MKSVKMTVLTTVLTTFVAAGSAFALAALAFTRLRRLSATPLAIAARRRARRFVPLSRGANGAREEVHHKPGKCPCGEPAGEQFQVGMPRR